MATVKRSVRKDRDAFLEELFRKNYGLITKIANHLGVTRASVSLWRRVPFKHLKAMEKFLNVPRSKLRADLYD